MISDVRYSNLSKMDAVEFHTRAHKLMMRIARVSLLLCCVVGFILTAYVVWADILPNPVHRPITPPAPPNQDDAQISMSEASVTITLHRQSSQLITTVVADFKMVYSQGSKPSTQLEMAMPVLEGEKPANYRLKYLRIDGKPVAADQVKQSTWVASPTSSYQGFVWPDTMNRGAVQTVSIAYELTVPRDARSAWHVTYILKSGAKWSGPIGHEIVRMVPEKGLKLRALPSSMKSRREADGAIVWEIENQKPTDDAVVEVTPAPKS